MRYTSKWNDYELIDCSSGERLERWENTILIRPDPQIIWNTNKNDERWNKADAIYHRSNTGGGSWEIKNKKLKDSWKISYNKLNFGIKMMNFKHTGVFPEQAVNWDLLNDIISKSKKPLNVLNLFAYTGGATLACAQAGAKVCHVDASKGMVSWARENAKISNMEDKPIRWIVDDCEKFVLREIKREKKYEGIIMDPPSYGRGPKGEIWKIEESVFPFIELCSKILSDDPLFFLINSYTTGLQPAVLNYMINTAIVSKFGGHVEADEIGVNVSSNGLVLPCGASGRWSK